MSTLYRYLPINQKKGRWGVRGNLWVGGLMVRSPVYWWAALMAITFQFSSGTQKSWFPSEAQKGQFPSSPMGIPEVLSLARGSLDFLWQEDSLRGGDEGRPHGDFFAVSIWDTTELVSI